MSSDGLEAGWLETIVAWASQNPRIDSIYLFGSRAKGEHGLESDVDLAFVMNGTENDTAYGYWLSSEFEAARKNLEATLPAKLDLQFMNPVTDEIVAPSVRDHGRRLYLRPGAPTLQELPAARTDQSTS